MSLQQGAGGAEFRQNFLFGHLIPRALVARPA
jgi:hypothetical protein